MNARLGVLLCGWALGLLFGCERRLTVYADPWLGDFAEKTVAAYTETHPDVRVELRLLSSELVAWHIRYGQPVDVFLCLGPEVMDSLQLRDKVADSWVMGDAQMALVGARPSPRHAEFKTEGCLALEATHRPTRRYADQWMQSDSFPEIGDCRVYAGFQSQMRDYMLRSWLPYGVLPSGFARRHSSELQTLASGPVIRGAYTAFLLQKNRDPEAAADFFKFLQSEKSREFLAAEIPFP